MTYRDNAIVLKTHTLSGADRLYTLLTERHGIIAALAKGSRKTKSKLSPHLASFGVVDVLIARGKQFDRLAGAELVSSYRDIAQSFFKMTVLSHLWGALYFTMKRESPDQTLFNITRDLLGIIENEKKEDTVELLCAAGAFKIIDTLGFALNLSHCLYCESLLQANNNTINVLSGGIVCKNCKSNGGYSISEYTIKTLRFFRSESFLTIRQLKISDATRREVMNIIDEIFIVHGDDRCRLFGETYCFFS